MYVKVCKSLWMSFYTFKLLVGGHQLVVSTIGGQYNSLPLLGSHLQLGSQQSVCNISKIYIPNSKYHNISDTPPPNHFFWSLLFFLRSWFSCDYMRHSWLSSTHTWKSWAKGTGRCSGYGHRKKSFDLFARCMQPCRNYSILFYSANSVLWQSYFTALVIIWPILKMENGVSLIFDNFLPLTDSWVITKFVTRLVC